MRNSFQGLAAKVESTLKESPFSGHLLVFRGRQGHLLKILWIALEQGRFVWPQAHNGKVYLTPAQLAILLEGLEWKQPKRSGCRLSVL